MKPTSTSPVRPLVALYGGSFDPVHSAHLMVAQAAQVQLNLDKVVFIPAARSPLKANTVIASDADRIEMLRLATAAEPRFEIDASEIERGGTSYTFETVNEYRRLHPECRLYWIIGADQVELLPQWHRIEEIAVQVTFILLRRPSYTVAAPPIAGLRTIEIEAPLMGHSSSEIRRRLAEGEAVADLLPPSVEAFISSQGLYTP